MKLYLRNTGKSKNAQLHNRKIKQARKTNNKLSAHHKTTIGVTSSIKNYRTSYRANENCTSCSVFGRSNMDTRSQDNVEEGNELCQSCWYKSTIQGWPQIVLWKILHNLVTKCALKITRCGWQDRNKEGVGQFLGRENRESYEARKAEVYKTFINN